MTSQGEVIEAFARQLNSPRRASNFEMRLVGNGSKAYLVGGDHAVYAKREPLNQLTVYLDWADRGYWYRSASIGSRHIKRQARKVRNFLVGTSWRDPRIDTDEQGIELQVCDPEDGVHRPTVDDFDEI